MAKVCATMPQKICTLLFIIFWIFFLLGTLLMHASLSKLVPACVDLPDNLIKGFGEVFKFDDLDADAAKVKAAAASAIAKCNINNAPISAEVYCPANEGNDPPYKSEALTPSPTNNPPSQTPDTSEDKQNLQDAFSNSLDIIETVTSDPYLGTPALNETGAQLADIKQQMNEIDTGAECYIAVPVYCSIWQSSEELVDGVATVNAEIDKFENSDMMKMYEENADNLVYMHVLPWVYGLSLVIYTVFWKLGGVCCCCEGGTCLKTCILLPHFVCCMLFFAICTIFVAIGFAWNEVVYPETTIDMFNGNPTIEVFCVHLQEKFPDFWKTVFLDLEDGLKGFFGAACVCFAAVIAMTIYEILVCLTRVYGGQDKTDA